MKRKMKSAGESHSKNKYIQDRYIKPIEEREAVAKKQRRHDWWKNNWIALLSLVFAIIAALPVIVQAVEAILGLLG